MTGYDRYRYNPFTDSFVEEKGIDRLIQDCDFTTVRMSDLEKCRADLKFLKEELEVYKKALKMACEDIYRFVGNEFGENYKNPCDYADGYLQKAREQE